MEEPSWPKRVRNTVACSSCHKEMTTASYRRHFNEMHGGAQAQRLACPSSGCAKTFVRKDHLQRHVERLHAPRPPQGRQHRCAHCAFWGPSLASIASHHQQVHATNTLTVERRLVLLWNLTQEVNKLEAQVAAKRAARAAVHDDDDSSEDD